MPKKVRFDPELPQPKKRSKPGFFDRLRNEFRMAMEDTSASMDEVWNVFTLQPAEIAEVVGRIDEATHEEVPESQPLVDLACLSYGNPMEQVQDTTISTRKLRAVRRKPKRSRTAPVLTPRTMHL